MTRIFGNRVEGATKWEQGQMTNMKVEGGKAPDKFTDRHRQPAWIYTSPLRRKLATMMDMASLSIKRTYQWELLNTEYKVSSAGCKVLEIYAMLM